ncbi:MAG: efflux RND transporter periplasmic adaptor subunit [Syntrophomonadaceae bacterium]|nr:efflux RND transporter periplasmic adaptor subunit [Syntrophomonadaceae bacterium]
MLARGLGLLRRGRRVSLLVVGVLAVCVLGSGCGTKEAETVKLAEIPVEVQEVKQGDVARVAIYAGTLRGIEEATVFPKLSAMSGAVKVVAVNVKPGDRVSKGQSLVQLDGSDLQYQIRGYQAQVDSLQASKVGAELRLANAKTDLERKRFLFDQGAIAKAELERAETEYQSAQAALAGVNAQIAGAQANLDNARNNLANCNVPSPISGTVGIVNVNVGDAVTAQTPVAVVTNTSRMEVQVNVSESEVSYVKPGRSVQVYVDSAGAAPFTGTVTSVAQTADARVRTYPVKVSLENKNGTLKSGMFAEVHLTTLTRQQVIAIPRDAVAEKGARRVVYIVDDKSVAHERDVVLGVEGEKLVEIVKGVKAGERIVTRGQTLIHDGDKVRVVAGGVKK